MPKNRLEELKTMRAWIEKFNGVYITVSDKRLLIPFSDDMRNVIHGMCLGEISKLEKEFEEL